jgi:hypothetical protein
MHDDDQTRVAPSVPGVVGQDLPQRGPTGEVTAEELARAKAFLELELVAYVLLGFDRKHKFILRDDAKASAKNIIEMVYESRSLDGDGHDKRSATEPEKASARCMGQNETTLMRDSPGAEAGSEPADSHQSAGVVPSPPLAHSIERHVERYDGDGHLVQASCLDCGYVYEDDDQARVGPSVPRVEPTGSTAEPRTGVVTAAWIPEGWLDGEIELTAFALANPDCDVRAVLQGFAALVTRNAGVVPSPPPQNVEETKDDQWRVGSKIPINVYDGDRPVCQCQTVADARKIVTAVNYFESRSPDGDGPSMSSRASGVCVARPADEAGTVPVVDAASGEALRAGSEPADSHQPAGVVPRPPPETEMHDDDQARVAPSVPGVVGQDLPQSGNEPKPDAAERPGTVYHETYEQWRVYHLLHGSLEARAQYTECLHCGATYWHQAGIPARPRARAQTTDAIDERLESYRTAQAARGLGLSQEADDLGWLLARVRELEGQLERET